MRKYLVISVAVATLALGGCQKKAEEPAATNDSSAMENVTVPENDAGGSSTSTGGSNTSDPGASSTSTGGHDSNTAAPSNETAPAGTKASSTGGDKI